MKYVFQNMGGINWTWVLCYEVVHLPDGREGARIVFYERWHNFDHNMMPDWVEKALSLREKMPRTVGDSAEIKEGAGRIAIALEFPIYEEIGPKEHPYNLGIDGKRYRHVGIREVPIANPAYVSSYRDFDEVKEWIEKGDAK